MEIPRVHGWIFSVTQIEFPSCLPRKKRQLLLRGHSTISDGDADLIPVSASAPTGNYASSHPRCAPLPRSQHEPLFPSELTLQAPTLVANRSRRQPLPSRKPPPLLRGKAKAREAARGAQLSLNHTAPGPRRPPAPPCDPLAVSVVVWAPVPAATSDPRPPLPPFAFSSQPPPLVGLAPSRPQRPLASPPPASASRASRTFLPRATPLFRLSAASSRFPLHPPASARLFLRAIPHAHRPCRTDRS